MLCSVTQSIYTHTHKMILFFYSLLSFLLLLRISAVNPLPPTNFFNSFLPSDAVALLSFKSTADLDDKLLYSLTEPYDYCQWRGVECSQDRVVRLVLDGVGLRGRFSPETLSRLDRLRVLSLENNSLTGSIPDLTPLVNLRSLILSRNGFSGGISPSILSLRRLISLDLSYNNFSGSIPSDINALSRLSSLGLEFNRFSGSLPPLYQSYMTSFNVSGNNLTGTVPFTATLSRFNSSSFLFNPGLCGDIIDKSCGSRSPPFFVSPKPNATSSSSSSSSQAPIGQTSQTAQNGEATAMTNPLVEDSSENKKSKSGWLVLGFTIGLASLTVLGLCLVVFSLVIKKRRDDDDDDDHDVMMFQRNRKGGDTSAQTPTESHTTPSVQNSNSKFKSQKREDENKDFKIQIQTTETQNKIPRSGDLIFCGDVDGGESGGAMYTLDQLMRASAELLGRGSVGTTYKAVMVNHMIVTVKRFAPSKTAITSDLAFENHMEMVGRLRHTNLVKIKAYFQSNGERLVIYDYQPNGSLFNLIHGSRAAKAKPLHWTSCLKIAEDVAQALHYIHQSPVRFHGNLKSTNILLGHDFEACLTDYCLSVLTDTSCPSSDPDISSYKAPEIRKSTDSPTSKCDVYSFGVFLLELLTGKTASRQPFMAEKDMLDWVRAMRQEDEKPKEENGLEMMTRTASLCRVTSPEQRPTMREVIRLIQDIKESVVMIEEKDISQYA